MPKYADHEERRDELADTVREIILDHGINRVSVRSVAQRSGWSVGAVRYYFPRQEDLLVHALERTSRRAAGRIINAEHSHPDDPLERAVCIVKAVAPVDDDARNDMRIWMSFLEQGLSDERTAAIMDRVWSGGRYFSRRIVASLAGLPLPEEIDEMLEDPFMNETATVLHVMWDGVSFQGLMSGVNLTPDETDRLIRRVLNTINDRIQNHLRDPLSTT
jgi:AcrR family transcriptional regulator